MTPHGPQPAPEPADQQVSDDAGQLRLAHPPPAWGGPGAQYTEALPHIPLPSGDEPQRKARHRQPDTGEVPAAADVRAEALQASADVRVEALQAAADVRAEALPVVVPFVAPAPAESQSTPVVAEPPSGPVLAASAFAPPVESPYPSAPVEPPVLAEPSSAPAPAESAYGPRLESSFAPTDSAFAPRVEPPFPPAPVEPVYQPTRQVPVVAVDGLVAWFRGWPVRRISVGGLVATLSAILLVIGSFAPFVSYGGAFPNLLKLGAPLSYSAWSARTFLFPLSALPVVLAIVVVAMVCVGMRPGSGSVPLPFGSRQLTVAAAGGAFLIMAGYAAAAKAVVFEPVISAPAAAGVTLSFGGGGVTMLLASLAMLVGAVIHLAGIGPELAPSTE